MQYVSTRGEAPALGFCDAVLAGLARDGGLYVPKHWPQIDADTIKGFRGQSYVDVAKAVLTPFVGDEIETDVLSRLVDEAYADFGHPAIAPLVQIDSNRFVLELFHGPTMAFKDVAMQLLARLMDHILAKRNERITIVGATSGDTGGAAIEAFKGRENCDIFILYPHGKVSDVQRWQMTGVSDANVHALAIEGNFDDCQSLVKAMFNHHTFRDRYRLSGVNSINWGRIMAQVVYYFTAATSLGSPDRKVSFCVPTGNFGDIFAGFVAKAMGLPIDELIIATNVNDILVRTLETGRYETAGVHATTSPSMDIQVSSNFERLIFEACNRDDAQVRQLMNALKQSGSFRLPDYTLNAVRSHFRAARVSEDEVADTIESLLKQASYLVDTHTAIGVHAAKQSSGSSSAPMVVLGTAHPAKFPDAVESACGTRPALPERQKDLMKGKERFKVLSNTLDAVEDHIAAHSRVNE
ncbi:MAG: threonine synthase [Ahrensia sp.]|nr:threonine synthase [Ahrensia sp.]